MKRWISGETYTLEPRVARNSASTGIHSDAGAQRQGFERAIVAGPNHLSFVASAFEEQLGAEWLNRGRISARFTAPVYDGDEITAEIAVGSAGDDFEASWRTRNQTGVVVAAGAASWVPESEPIRPERASSLPEVLLDLRDFRTGERVPSGTVTPEPTAVAAYVSLTGDSVSSLDAAPTGYLTFLLFGPARRWMDSRGVGFGMWGEIDIAQHAPIVPGRTYRYDGSVLSVRRRGDLELIDFAFAAHDADENLVCSIAHTHIIPHRDRS